ncbi:hypothetical protein RRG08_004127 [Elysia crispata]|uniref:Uncharacterized protein n=1 Tax=Elysia crispata TaxID=231223 RepID=A0AAE0YXE7_9GAST|nr:hypothetical protein RRG08_004127 [Elysia crispata]
MMKYFWSIYEKILQVPLPDNTAQPQIGRYLWCQIAWSEYHGRLTHPQMKGTLEVKCAQKRAPSAVSQNSLPDETVVADRCFHTAVA